MTAVVDDVEDAFRSALEKDAGTQAASEVAPPPRKPVLAPDPDAPHGRDENGEPYAPYGLNKKTGRPNIKPAGPGRARKGDKPRVDDRPADGTKAGKEPKDYSQQIAEFTEGAWMLMSSAPVPVPKLRTRIHAQAAIVRSNTPGIVKGVNLCAQNNETIGRGVDKLTTGGASWILPAMFALGPFVAQSAMMWRTPIGDDIEALARGNEEAWDETVKAMIQAAALQEAVAEAEAMREAA